VFSDAQLPSIEDERKVKANPLNANFHKKEFQELWSRINRKAAYAVLQTEFPAEPENLKPPLSRPFRAIRERPWRSSS
jgi:hypothetical protein